MDLFDAEQFSAGFLIGAVTLAVTFPIALGLSALFRSWTRRPGLVGPAFTIAVVLALGGAVGTDEIRTIPPEVVTGVALLWLAGTIAAFTPWPWAVGPIAALPGAVVLAGANGGLDAGWVPEVILVGSVLIGATAADLNRRTGRFGVASLLLFVTVGGIYLTVPDTELMRAVVGVALPLVLLAWPYAAASLGGGGAYAAVGLLLWITPIDGIGRPGAIVGAVGAFALLIGEPLGRVLARALLRTPRIRRFPVRYPCTVAVGAQILLVLYAARVAGRVQTASEAAVLLIPALAAAVAFGVFLVMPERERERERE